MRERDLIDAMGGIDYRYIADAAPTGRKHKRRNLAMVASLCLVVTIAFLWMGQAFSPRATPVRGTISLIDHTVSRETLTYDYSAAHPSSSGSSLSGSPPQFDFHRGFVVEARVIEVLPDEYHDLLRGGRWRLLKLQVLDVVEGIDVPQEFYFRLPPRYAAEELMQYDSLIIGMKQDSLEGLVLLNTQTNTFESFSAVFRTCHDYGYPEMGCTLAFTDGTLDTSLWTLPGWNFHGVPDTYLSKESDYPVSIGDTIARAKKAIWKSYDKWREYGWYFEPRTYTLEEFKNEDARTALSYVKAFDNGVFLQSALCQNPPSLHYTRYINGYPSTEQVHINDTDQVLYYGEAFTEQDLTSIPDIHAIIEQNDFSSIAPPHTPHYQELTQTSHGTTGWYTKVNGKVYGIIKVYWDFCVPYDPSDMSIHDPIKTYYDDMYIIAYPDGSYHEIDREELRALIVTEDGVNEVKISTQPYNTIIEKHQIWE